MAKRKRNQLIERRDTKTQTEKEKRYWKRKREKKKSKFTNEKMGKTTRQDVPTTMSTKQSRRAKRTSVITSRLQITCAARPACWRAEEMLDERRRA
jgi:hypothetical protein